MNLDTIIHHVSYAEKVDKIRGSDQLIYNGEGIHFDGEALRFTCIYYSTANVHLCNLRGHLHVAELLFLMPSNRPKLMATRQLLNAYLIPADRRQVFFGVAFSCCIDV